MFYFGNARPKSNARAHLKQRKIHSGLRKRIIIYLICYYHRLTHAGQLLCGLSGPVVMGGTPVISTVWFPENQRTSATAFATVMGGMGTAVSFVLGNTL